MPFFNFRRSGSTSAPNAAAAAQHESLEVVRKRAKHRLIGAAVLVLAGVVGFPLLFDTQPRPIAIDIPIEIPGKNTVKPLGMPAKAEVSTSEPVAPGETAAPATPPAPYKVAAASSLSSKEEIIADKRPVASVLPAPSAPKTEAKLVQKPEAKAEAKAEAKPEIKPEPKSAEKPAAPADDGARARALLNGQAAAPAAATAAASSTPAGADSRIVVQVGAFADAAKAREVRLKLEKAGLKTYTQVAETAGGKRTRVRVGPFATRAEADKAASKIKSLDLQAAVLTL